MKRLATLLFGLFLTAAVSFGQVNYSFSSGSTTFTALSGASAFTWTTTTPNDEEYSAATNIFDGTETFTYAGTAYTQFQVSSNGFLRLGTGLAAATATDALSGSIRSIIAPLWDDLAVGTTATDITYQVTGSSGSYVLTVEWNNVKWNKTAAAANAQFQVKLYQATGVIEFVYGTMTAPTAGSASIGLADNTTITSTTNPTTNRFVSINIGGTAGSRTFHRSRGYLFNAIDNYPDAGTLFTFTPTTPSGLSGTFTVGGASPDYATPSDAAQALNINGVSGPVTMSIRSGTYDDILHLTNVAGTSATNTITIKAANGATVVLAPKNGSGTSTAGGSFTSDAIVRLDGTQYTTIQDLTLNDNGQSSVKYKFAIGVMLGNAVNTDGTMSSGGRFNLLKNLTIDMKATTGTPHIGAIGIRYFTSSSTETDTGKTTSYNTIDNCTITGFWRAGWKNFGISGTNPDRGNVIKNCTIGNVSFTTGSSSDMRAIEIDVQKNLTIQSNVIENIENTILTTGNIYGIWLNPASSGTNLNSGTIVIRDNIIRSLKNSGSGVTTGFAVGIASNNILASTEFQIFNNRVYDIYSNGTNNGSTTSARAYGIGLFLSTGVGAVAKIYNNMISDIRAPRTTLTHTVSQPGVRGMDLQNGAGTATFTVYHNTINLDNSVAVTGTNQRSTGVFLSNFGTATLDFRNNIVINTQGGGASGSAVAIQASSNGNLKRMASTSDYNLYYIGTSSASKGISFDSATVYQTLTDHQTAVASGGLGGPRDVNSKSAVVTFSNALSNLHIAGGSLGDVTNLVASIVSSPYNVDIDGETRNSSTPYKGADENIVTLLPVELTAFTAVAKGKNVELRWATATEHNNFGFEVERSVNGSWSKVGFVPGAGTSNAPKEYSYSDAVSQDGRIIYRLKQIDVDGQFAYMNTVEVSVSNGTVNDYQLAQNFPNPFNPVTTIRFAVKQQEQTSVRVYDITGKEVAELFNGVAAPGQVYNVQFNGAGLASGIYFYVLQTPSMREVKKMQMLK